jgi:hypothetical protein
LNAVVGAENAAIRCRGHGAQEGTTGSGHT